MPNPFSGIISAELKNIHKQMIDSLLEDDALTVPVRFYYGVTKWDACSNCSPSVGGLGRKGSSVYIHGGPAPFSFGQQCPVCGGESKIPVETNETLNLACIFRFGRNSTLGFAPDGTFAQTFCGISLFPKIKQANYVLFDTNIEAYTGYKYQRKGEPEPMGFGQNAFILTTWERV